MGGRVARRLRLRVVLCWLLCQVVDAPSLALRGVCRCCIVHACARMLAPTPSASHAAYVRIPTWLPCPASRLCPARVADYVVLNKVDMLGPGTIDSLSAIVASLNPLAQVRAALARLPHSLHA